MDDLIRHSLVPINVVHMLLSQIMIQTELIEHSIGHVTVQMDEQTQTVVQLE